MTNVVRRLGALLSVEVRTQWRQRVPVVVLGLAAFWSVLLVVLPRTVSEVAAPYLLFVDVLTVGTLFVGAQTVTDKATGATAALATSPLRSSEYLTAKLVPLTTLTVVSAVPILFAGRLTDRLGVGLSAVALSTALLLAVAVEIANRTGEFVRFMLSLAAPIAALFVVPLAVSIGLLAGPWWYALPTTGALAVLSGTTTPFAGEWLLAYLALGTIVVAAYASGSLRQQREQAGRARSHVRPLAIRPRWLVFPRADVRNLTRDSMLGLVALSPVLLALALRFGYPPLAGWLRAHGWDVTPYEPVFAIGAVVVHVPVSFGMVGALLVLDDLEDGVLGVVRTSPMGLGRFLAYRLLAVTTLSAGGVAVAAPLSGLVPVSVLPALPVAVLLGPLMMVAMLAVAATRVQGVTAAKVLALPAYVPVAAWWLTGPAGWLLAPFPTSWITSFWADRNPLELLAALVFLLAWLLVLARRAERRLAEA